VVGRTWAMTSELDATLSGSMELSSCGGAAHDHDHAGTSLEVEVHADRSDSSEVKMK